MEDYLYHYTTIESLALILKNRTIRLNSLDKMDDKQEQMTSDSRRIGQFVYVSSWTDEKEESIPMWNMYASLDRGVRIALPKNPFKLYENSLNNVASLFDYKPINPNDQNAVLRTYIELADLKNHNMFSIQSLNLDPDNGFLFKVEYTEAKDKLYPSILKADGDHISIDFGSMGKFKNTGWSFQKEWRYIWNIIPIDYSKTDVFSLLKSYTKSANDIYLDKAIQIVPYWDLSISDEAYAKMQITLSPKLSAGNRLIAENIIEKYNPSAKILESKFINLL